MRPCCTEEPVDTEPSRIVPGPGTQRPRRRPPGDRREQANRQPRRGRGPCGSPPSSGRPEATRCAGSGRRPAARRRAPRRELAFGFLNRPSMARIGSAVLKVGAARYRVGSWVSFGVGCVFASLPVHTESMRRTTDKLPTKCLKISHDDLRPEQYICSGMTIERPAHTHAWPPRVPGHGGAVPCHQAGLMDRATQPGVLDSGGFRAPAPGPRFNRHARHVPGTNAGHQAPGQPRRAGGKCAGPGGNVGADRRRQALAGGPRAPAPGGHRRPGFRTGAAPALAGTDGRPPAGGHAPGRSGHVEPRDPCRNRAPGGRANKPSAGFSAPRPA